MDWYHCSDAHTSHCSVSCISCIVDSFMSVMKPHFVQGVSNTVDGRGGGGLGMFRLNPSQRTLEFVITFDGINDIEGR